MTPTLRRTAVAATASLVVFALLPVAAEASGSVSRVGGPGCASSGGGTFACQDYIAGGTAPYTATGTTMNFWASIGQITITDDGSYYEVLTQGSCTVGTSTGTRITVTDAAGQTLTIPGMIHCTSWSQQ